MLIFSYARNMSCHGLDVFRTHPSYRRRGVATALTHACLRWASRQGAEVARLATEADNVAAQHALERLAFTQVSEFLVMKCPCLRAQRGQRSRWATATDTEDAWNLLLNSETYRKSAGLYTIVFTWCSLDKPALSEFIHTGRAVIHEATNGVDGVTLVDETARQAWPEENPLQTCYVDGTQKAIVDMMAFVKDHAHTRKFGNLYAFACDAPPVAAALTAAGFVKESTNELIYEKRLPSASLEA